jgi:predicted phosphodiesterase
MTTGSLRQVTPKKILFVENEPEWIGVIQEIIGPPDFDVQIATSYLSAKARILTSSESFDMVIVNLCLVNHSDYEGVLLLDDLVGHHVPCIVLTGAQTGTRGLYERYGVYEVIIKGQHFNKAKLREVIKEVIETHSRVQRPFDIPVSVESVSSSQPSCITWLHVSDFHFRAGKTWDSRVVLEDLLRDLEDPGDRISPSVERIDLVFVTGDLSYSGHFDEYQVAGSFLKQLRRVTRVRKDRMFVVPGNHDVNRKAISPLASRTLLQNRDSVNRVYHDGEARRLFLKRFDNYRQFVNDNYSHISLDDDSFHYVRRRTISGKVVCVTGLNSAWASSGDGEYGKLILGDVQVREALKAGTRKKADVRISLFHHPLDWLREFDRDDCEPLCHSGFDFVLHGHLHKTGILTLTAPDRQAMVLGAGACYLGRDKPNAYNFVHLDFENRRGVVYLREYTERAGGHWTIDAQTYRGVEGKYEFTLPDSLCS